MLLTLAGILAMWMENTQKRLRRTRRPSLSKLKKRLCKEKQAREETRNVKIASEKAFTFRNFLDSMTRGFNNQPL